MALDIVAWGAITFGLTVFIQGIFFAIATIFKTDKVTDFSGSLNFFVLALVGLLWPSDYFARQIVLCSLQMLWAIRLGLYLTSRVWKRGKDARFDEIHKVWWMWALFWSTQITWVWVVSLPVTFIVATHIDKPLNAVDYVGWSIFGIALLVETISDWHRSSFNSKNRDGQAQFIHTGFWRWSRHPNYCAEIFVWIGIWLSSSNGLWDVDTAYGVLGLFSPLITFVLLAFISGIPPAEKRDDARFKDVPEYYDYKKRTSPLWFFPTTLYNKMPMVLRKVPFCDIYDYTKLRQETAPVPAEDAQTNAATADQQVQDQGWARSVISDPCCHHTMLPLFKYFVNTAVLAPLVVKHVMKFQLDYSQVLNILAVASVLNVLSNCRKEKCWSAKQISNGVFGMIAGVGFYYIVAVIFGAYLCQAYQSTLTWAIWMSSMTAYPLGLLYGLDFNRWFETVIRRNDHGSKDESRLICSIYSIWAGAWASSVVIPLDWNRAWQKWPIPNVIGALALCLTTSLGFWLKDGCKMNWSECNWGKCNTVAAPKAAAKTPRKAPAAKSTPVKAAAVAKASPAKSAKKATPAKASSPVRKAPVVASRTRSRSPSKSPVKRSASPAKAAVPSTPKATARSRSKVATPSAGRASSRLSKRTL